MYDPKEQDIKELDALEWIIRNKIFTNQSFTDTLKNNYNKYVKIQNDSKKFGLVGEETFKNYITEFTKFTSYKIIHKPYVGDNCHKNDLDYGDFEFRYKEINFNFDFKISATKVTPVEYYCASIKLNNIHNFKGKWDICFNAFNTKAVIIKLEFLRFLLYNNYFEGKNWDTSVNQYITFKEYMAAFAKYEAEGNSLDGLVRIIEKKI